MELHQLRYLVSVVEEGGFTRAAEREHVAQPGVSAQVRRLERELGHALLDRSARGVRPTAAGEAVLPHARAALAAVDAARATADELSGMLRGRVAIGMVRGGGVVDLPALLGGFHRAHPGVELHLVEDATDALLDAVRTHELDLAWVGRAGPQPDDLDADVVMDTPLALAVGHDDPWSGRRAASAADLADRTVIALPPGAGVRTAFDRACAAAGVTVRPALEAGTPPMLADLAAQGLGVAVVPSVAVAGRDDVHVVDLTPAVRARIDLVWRRDAALSPAARAMLEHARGR